MEVFSFRERSYSSPFLFPRILARDSNFGAFHAQLLDAASAPRDGAAMWTCLRMAQKSADAVSGLGREDVFEFAGLLFHLLLIIDFEGLREQTLGQTVAADNIGGTLTAAIGEVDH